MIKLKYYYKIIIYLKKGNLIMSSEIEIKSILNNSVIDVKFQPIMSIATKSIIGFDGISLGAKVDDNFLDLEKLFEVANQEDSLIDLDRLIRERIVEDFNKIPGSSDRLLFISIDMSVIEKHVGSGIIFDLVNRFNIDPKNVVLEIFENNISDIDVLKQFINSYRSKGFLVALAIGSGFANLDKISHVEPDVIKISEAITKDIAEDFYKQEIFKSLINLSKKISAMVIADGINLEEQAIIAMELGADMLQGNFFGGYDTVNKGLLKSTEQFVNQFGTRYRKYKEEQVEFEKGRQLQYKEFVDNVIKELTLVTEKSFDSKLHELVNKYDAFECVYVLDANGIQITDTATHLKNILSQKALIFKPAKKGTDHSLKKYYYFLNNLGLNKYVTDAYISSASGNLCITISEKFITTDKNEYIICIDFNPSYINL